MLQEIGYAFRHYGISSGDLVAMATSTPANLVRISDYVGALAAGRYADFVVIDVKVDPTKSNFLDPVVKATPADVALVVVGGKPVYGDEALLKQISPSADLDIIRVCGADKAIDLTNTAASDRRWKLNEIRSHLKKALEPLGTSLAEIECD